MAKKDENEVKLKKIEKPLLNLNKTFTNLINSITPNSGTQRDQELRKVSNEIDDVVYQEIQSMTKYTGDDISMFLTKTFIEQEKSQRVSSNMDIEDLFENESTGMLNFLQDRYNNQNLLFEDLKSITDQLYELQEAVYAIRDSVVTADDLSSMISRNITFKNNTDTESVKNLRGIVETMEEKFGIQKKLKNHIIPNTLQYGRYYVYTVPYSELFKSHMKRKHKEQTRTTGFDYTLESTGPDMEVFAKKIKTDYKISSTPKDIQESISDIMSGIEVYNDEEFIPMLESGDLSDELINQKIDKYQKESAKRRKDNKNLFNDGTFDPDAKENDFSFVKDCYVKLIDPRKIIPVKILDETIGYYYVHDQQLKVSKTPFTNRLRMSPQETGKDLENSLLSKITDKIVKSFDKKYLENNTKFKELILNTLLYNDIYKKELKFQFIPVDYITEFAVNEDAEGNGTSILMPSLFYSKLYLALLIFKMITIVSNSNDQRIHYVRSSGLDNNVANKIQEIARSVKEREINFTDLMNYTSMIGKIGRNKSIFMPVGRTGERGIEMDILAGQDVQLNTELMELLRTGFINGTGVPSVIMNYVNEADYAKTLVMANAKFAGRVVSFQLDFNPDITELYRKLMRFSTDMEPDDIEGLTITLAPPKALDALNMADLISNVDQTVAFAIKALRGEQAEVDDNENIIRDEIYKVIAKDVMKMFHWEHLEELVNDAEVEAVKRQLKKKQKDDSGAV